MAGNGKSKLGGKKKLFTALVAAVLVVGAVAYFGLGKINVPFLSGVLARSRETMVEGAGDKGTRGRDEYRQIDLEPLVVNLADPGGRRYLRVAITLEYADPRVEKEMERVSYRVRDAIIRALRSKTVADLAPEHSDKVREELLNTINELLEAGRFTGLYFQEFIIQ